MNKKIFHKLSFLFLLGTLVSPSFCAEESKEVKEIPEVVVSADRIEEPLKEVTSQVTVITKEELEKKNFIFITDVFYEPSLKYIFRHMAVLDRQQELFPQEELNQLTP